MLAENKLSRQRAITALITLCVLCTVTYPQQVCSGKKALLIEDVPVDTRPYHLVFSDEFAGSFLDTSVWYPATGVLRHVQSTKYWLDPANLEVKNGILYIRAKKDTFLNQCFDIWIDTAVRRYCKDFYYSAGEIRTKSNFSHGIFEIRCKFPRANGIGLAFWAFGSDHNEIDVFEIINEYNVFGNLKEKKLSAIQRTNIRTDYENDKIIEDCSVPASPRDLHTNFHVFSAEWTPQKIVWRVDGEIIRISTLFYSIDGKMLDQGIPAHTEVIINDAFPRNPMEIYVSMGYEPHEPETNNADSEPYYFEIDYVRYYSK